MTSRRRFMQASAGFGLGLGRFPAEAAGPLLVAAYPQVDAIARAAIPRFERAHPGVRVQVVGRQIGDHHTAMMTALSTASYLPDVMAIEVGYLGRFARSGGLLDLQQAPFQIERERSRLVRFAYDQAVSASDGMVGVPSDIGPGTLLYRHDLLERAGVLPQTLLQSWETFIEAGVAIRRATGASLLPNAQDLVDIVIRSGLRSGDGLYVDNAGQPQLTSARFVRAFELARELRRQRLDAQVLAWSSDWAQGIRGGEIACLVSGAWMVGHMQQWLAPNSSGRWRASALPEQACATFGGTFLALPRFASPLRRALAWEFIRLLTLDAAQQLQAFHTFDAFPVLLDTYGDAFFRQPIPYLGGQQARLLWRQTAEQARAIRVDKQDPFAAEVVATALFEVLHEQRPIARALGRAQDELQRRLGR